MKRFLGVILLALIFQAGCGPAAPKPVEPPTGRTEILNSLRSGLTVTSQNGEAGSGMDAIFDDHKRLKEADAALYEKLHPTLEKLAKTGSASERKKLASEALAALPANESPK